MGGSRVRRTIAAVGAVTLIASGMVAFAPPASAAPAITVTPNTGLTDGQSVTVAGTGFETTGLHTIAQCADATPLTCATGTFANFEMPENGAFSVSYTVHREMTVLGDGVDCSPPTTCYVLVRQASPFGPSATAPITFTPGDPQPEPELTVTPDTGLVDGQTVSVHGTNFDANVTGRIDYCRAPGTDVYWCDPRTRVDVTTSPSGEFTVSYTVRRAIAEPVGFGLDCATRSCTIQASDFGPFEQGAEATLGFATSTGRDLAIQAVKYKASVRSGKPSPLSVAAANLGPTATTWSVRQQRDAWLDVTKSVCPKGALVGPDLCRYGPTFPKVGKKRVVKAKLVPRTDPDGVSRDIVCVVDETPMSSPDRNYANNCFTVRIVTAY